MLFSFKLPNPKETLLPSGPAVESLVDSQYFMNNLSEGERDSLLAFLRSQLPY